MPNISANILESQYTVNATVFTDVWDVVVIDMFGTWVSIFLYAFYLNLFLFAIYTLARRKTAGKKVLLGFTWTMAVLGTTQMALRLSTTVLTVRILQQFTERNPSGVFASGTLGLTKTAVFAINNLATDSLLLYRCYMIWGSRWKVVVVPGFLVVSTFVVACLSAASQRANSPLTAFDRVPYITAAATNLVLMLLTAGRIWWIRRDILHMRINHRIQDYYSKVIAMILESGAIYCIFATLLVTTTQLGIYDVLEAAAMHLVNIVPMLIIVRVGLGHHTQDATEIAASLAANATHQSMIHSARSSVQQPSNLPGWQVLDIKPSSGEKLWDQLPEEM